MSFTVFSFRRIHSRKVSELMRPSYYAHNKLSREIVTNIVSGRFRSKSREAFRKALERAVEPHGAVSRLARESGLSRATIDKWLRDESTPTLDNLDAVAGALGVIPWELIKPERAGAEASQPPERLDGAEALRSLLALLPTMKEPELRALAKYAATLRRVARKGETAPALKKKL